MTRRSAWLEALLVAAVVALASVGPTLIAWGNR
jgi:hypothetical protein